MESDVFDPRRYVTRVGGNEYLEVKWRVYWFRHDHPNGSIKTELITHHLPNPVNDAPGIAIFKATVSVGISGKYTDEIDFEGGSATGWGTEDSDDFRDYLEKAETKAIGRALAALGYGTQFASELSEGAAIADAPVRGNQRRAGSSPSVTNEQLNNLSAWREAQGLTVEEMTAIVKNITGVESIGDLSKEQAGKVLYNLNRHSLDDLRTATFG